MLFGDGGGSVYFNTPCSEIKNPTSVHNKSTLPTPCYLEAGLKVYR